MILNATDGEANVWQSPAAAVRCRLNEGSFEVGKTLGVKVCVKRGRARCAVTHSIVMPYGEFELRVGGC